MLAVTSEEASLTEPWIEQHAPKYGYAYDGDGGLARWFGVKPLPDAVLVDPAGTIVWRGNPADLRDRTIERALPGALTEPLWTWPDSAAAARAEVRAGRFAKALELAKGDEATAAGIRRIVAAHATALEAAHERGNVFATKERAELLAASADGLPEAARAAELLEAIAADDAAQAVLAAQIEIRALRGEARNLRKRADADRLLARLDELIAEHRGTHARTEARELSRAVKRRLPSFR